jgi:acetyl-CoA carboxylase carboxyl transferase subunit beta
MSAERSTEEELQSMAESRPEEPAGEPAAPTPAPRSPLEEAAAQASGEPAEISGEEPEPVKEEEPRRSRLRWKKKEVPAGLFIKCESCGATVFRKELEGRNMVCPSCGFHFTLGGRERITSIIDEGTWEERFADLETLDRLHFTDSVPYSEKVERTVARLGQKEALLCGTGEILGRRVVLAVLDFKFMGGSMGEIVGEKIALSTELARVNHLPLVIFTSSGGARMHEGMLSLMQMAKTCAALQELNEKGGLSICVMTNPTTGGVTASFASVCDFVLAEPGALIGFAGPRVIATTLKQELPKGFQRAEFLLEKGQIDRIVPRDSMKELLARLIDFGRGALG